MHGQKNHRNRFYRENPEARFVPVTEETLPAADEDSASQVLLVCKLKG